MGLAKDILKRLSVLANEIPGHMREGFFRPLLPSLVLLCQAFPPVCADTTEFLVSLSKECVSDVRDGVVDASAMATPTLGGGGREASGINQKEREGGLLETIRNTFQEIVTSTLVKV